MSDYDYSGVWYYDSVSCGAFEAKDGSNYSLSAASDEAACSSETDQPV